MFTGDLGGMHLGGDPQVIDGEWMLIEAAAGPSCTGSFTVQLQP